MNMNIIIIYSIVVTCYLVICHYSLTILVNNAKTEGSFGFE